MREGKCEQCSKKTWINHAVITVGALIQEVEICADCFDLLGIKESKSSRCGDDGRGGNAGSGDNNPGQDNAIRAMEGD